MFIVSMRGSINISTLYRDLYYRYNPGSQDTMISGWLWNIKWPRFTCLTHEVRPLLKLADHDGHLSIVESENTDIVVVKVSYRWVEETFQCSVLSGLLRSKVEKLLLVVWSLVATLGKDKGNKFHFFRC